MQPLLSIFLTTADASLIPGPTVCLSLCLLKLLPLSILDCELISNSLILSQLSRKLLKVGQGNSVGQPLMFFLQGLALLRAETFRNSLERTHIADIWHSSLFDLFLQLKIQEALKEAFLMRWRFKIEAAKSFKTKLKWRQA
jgi:hypothetical protein